VIDELFTTRIIQADKLKNFNIQNDEALFSRSKIVIAFSNLFIEHSKRIIKLLKKRLQNDLMFLSTLDSILQKLTNFTFINRSNSRTRDENHINDFNRINDFDCINDLDRINDFNRINNFNRINDVNKLRTEIDKQHKRKRSKSNKKNDCFYRDSDEM
jgi:hypothetical protein